MVKLEKTKSNGAIVFRNAMEFSFFTAI